MNTKACLWLSVILGLLAVIILFGFVPKKIYKPVGVLLPAKQLRPAISPSAVVRIQDRPLGSELLGYINIERKYRKGQAAQQEIWNLAQKLASQAGANAVIIKLFQVGAFSKGYYIYVFQGEAIHTPSTHGTLNKITSLPPLAMEF